MPHQSPGVSPGPSGVGHRLGQEGHRRARFNGATTFQPWKPALRRVGPRRISVLQWGHDLSAVETQRWLATPSRSLSCFNGATTFQPWKR